MRARSIVLVSMAAFLGLLSCNRPTEQELRIGVLLPLSGDAAVWGVSMREGIDLALDELDRSRPPGKARIALRYEDDRSQPRDGLSAVEKLVAVDKIVGLVGVANSSVALAIIPVLEKNKIVFVSGGASSPKLSGSSRYFFRTWPSDIVEALAMARYAKSQLHLVRVAVLYNNNDYGIGLRDPFRREFEKLGGRVVAEETFLQEATDFRTQLVSIGRAKPEAVYLIGNPREMARALKQANELGIHIQFLSVSGLVDPEVLKIAGAAAEGVLLTDASFDPESQDPETRRFIASFSQKHRKAPGMLAATGYDALRVLIAGYDAGGTNADNAANAIRSLKAFQGAAGPIQFDTNGDVSRPVRISTIKNGKFVTKEYLP